MPVTSELPIQHLPDASLKAALRAYGRGVTLLAPSQAVTISATALLARVGIPAVIAMQATISIAAAAQLTARLLRELTRDGRIDGALAAARAELAVPRPL